LIIPAGNVAAVLNTATPPVPVNVLLASGLGFIPYTVAGGSPGASLYPCEVNLNPTFDMTIIMKRVS